MCASNKGTHRRPEMGHNVSKAVLALRGGRRHAPSGVPGDGVHSEALAFNFQHRDWSCSEWGSRTERRACAGAEGVLGFLGDRRRRAHRPGRLALDVRAPRRYPRPPPRRRPRHREPVLGPYYAPVLGRTGDPQLAIYSHMINEFNLPVQVSDRHLIAFQLEERLRGPDSGRRSRRRLPTAGCCRISGWSTRQGSR